MLITLGLSFAYIINQLNTCIINNTQRSFYVASKGNPLFLIIYWHRTGGTANEFLQQGWYRNMTDVIVASPESILGPTEYEWFLVGSNNMTDVYLFDSILKQMNMGTVYVAGFSAGAIMASHLAFLRSNQIKLVAAMSGGFIFSENYNYVTSLPTIMTYTGGPKDVVSINNFTVATNIFLDSIKYANAKVYECSHNDGHVITDGESIDVYYFLTQSFSLISSACQELNFTFSTQPIPDKKSASSNDWIDMTVFYFLIPFTFLV